MKLYGMWVVFVEAFRYCMQVLLDPVCLPLEDGDPSENEVPLIRVISCPRLVHIQQMHAHASKNTGRKSGL